MKTLINQCLVTINNQFFRLLLHHYYLYKIIFIKKTFGNERLFLFC